MSIDLWVHVIAVPFSGYYVAAAAQAAGLGVTDHALGGRSYIGSDFVAAAA